LLHLLHLRGFNILRVSISALTLSRHVFCCDFVADSKKLANEFMYL